MVDRHGEGGPSPSGAIGPLSRIALRAQAKDPGALEALTRELSPYILWSARTHLTPAMRSRFEARDLVSLAWIAILENFPDLHIEGDGPLKAWVRRLIINKAIDAERSLHLQKNDVGREQSLDELMRGDDRTMPAALRTGDDEQLDRIEASAELARIRSCLDTMPPEKAETVWLIDFDGCTYAEAARLLGERESTVRMRHGAARARLARILCKPDRE